MMDNFKYNLERYLPAILLILFLMFFFFCRIIEKSRDFKEGLLWARQDSIRIADSLKRIEVEAKMIAGIHQDSIVKSGKEKLPVLAGEIRDTYNIIAGSFTNPENAKLAAAKYSNLGYKTSIIRVTNRNGIKTELISVKTYHDFNEAVRYLREIQKKSEPEAWLYSNQ